MSDNKSMARAAIGASDKVIESLVLRGDLSGLSPLERARHYVQMCESLGLNPSAQPFAFLRLNGKEILYATRGATDQLAKIHRVNREITDGPKVIDLAGTKLVYAVCRASMPDGRFETATATVPLVDPANVLMKAETKAKRRATLSILGLGLLDEMELETIPTRSQEPGGGVDLSLGIEAAHHDADLVSALEVQVCRCGDVSALADLWVACRGDVAALPKGQQSRAWKIIGQRAEAIGATAAAVRAEVQRRDTPTPPDGPKGGAPKPEHAEHTEASGESVTTTTTAQDAQAIALVPPWCSDVESMERHIAGYAHYLAVERCARKHRSGLPAAARELLALRYQRLSWSPHDGEITIERARELVARWIAAGPVERVRPASRAKIAAGAR